MEIAEFIAAGLTKDRWPYITAQQVRVWLDDPSELDDQEAWEKLIEDFYRYYDMYWRQKEID